MHIIKDINKRHINGQDSRYLYVAKKTEKIVSAVFMVTDLLGEDIQKIKRTLQEESISVLELVHELHAPAKFESTVLLTLEKKFTYIISLLEVALHVHVISESNANILIKEIQGCLERIHSIKVSPLSELQQQTLSENIFELPALMEPFEAPFESALPKVENKGVNQAREIKKTKTKNVSYNKPHKKTINTEATDQPKSESKNKRQETILGLLSKDKTVSIQYIYNNMMGVSSKTVQRDLNALIKDNKVVREGNKRWATYKKL